MKAPDYLDATKSKLSLSSDYALAKKLDVTKETISQIRRGKIHISEKMALKMAPILDINPAEIVISTMAERSKEPEMEAIWKGILEKISTGFRTLLPRAKQLGVSPTW